MSIGDNIRDCRKKSGLTLDALAKMIGTSKQTIQRYETGVISNIPSDKIEALSNALGVSPAYLMGWTITNKEIILTEREKQLISAYRNHPEMQSAIDTLLGINNKSEAEIAADMVNTIKQTEKSLSKSSNTKK